MTFKIVIASGGLDPVHCGHCRYLKAAKELGDLLIVGVNSDAWLIRKKGKPFMSFDERLEIVEALKPVDIALGFDDSDGSATRLIEDIINSYVPLQPIMGEIEIIFANGGDRTAENIPEMNRDYALPVRFEFGVGGANKAQSSSTLLKNWKD